MFRCCSLEACRSSLTVLSRCFRSCSLEEEVAIKCLNVGTCFGMSEVGSKERAIEIVKPGRHQALDRGDAVIDLHLVSG